MGARCGSHVVIVTVISRVQGAPSVSREGIEPSTRGLKVPCSATELPAHISPDSTSIIQRFVRPPPSPDFRRDNDLRESEQDAGSKWVAFSSAMSKLFIESTPYAELPTYTHDTYSIRCMNSCTLLCCRHATINTRRAVSEGQSNGNGAGASPLPWIEEVLEYVPWEQRWR